MEQKMICDLNLVSSPKYPSVSTASVTAGLARATDAHGHNCPTDKTFFSLDLKTTTHSALHMLVLYMLGMEEMTLAVRSQQL